MIIVFFPPSLENDEKAANKPKRNKVRPFRGKHHVNGPFVVEGCLDKR